MSGAMLEAAPDSAGERPDVTLEACRIWKRYANAIVLKEISLTILKGSFTLLRGPSGSGKTTLLSLLGALDRPDEGQVLFEGVDLNALSDIGLTRCRRRMGLVFQDHALIARLPAWENITYPLIPRGISLRARRRRAAEVLQRVGLSGFEERCPERLSGGERQRLSIARAIVAEPALLLADEPTSSLDDASAMAVIEILDDLHRSGTTLLVASHDARFRPYADRQIELIKGELLAIQSEGEGEEERCR